MTIDPSLWILVVLFFVIIAAIYSAVGFGGGSSYLAILSLLGFSFFFIRTNALLCNLVVVSASSFLFYKNNIISFKDVLPFIVASVPMTFIGASLRLDESIFFVLLAFTLIGSSFFLLWQTFLNKKDNEKIIEYPYYISYILGASIGVLSGLVGIGGGVFLAPILNHLKWGRPMKIAGLTAFFILANSISGLLGLVINKTFEYSLFSTIPLLFAVFIGGQIGVRYSIKRNNSKWIKVFTAVLVLIVGIRILFLRGFEYFF